MQKTGAPGAPRKNNQLVAPVTNSLAHRSAKAGIGSRTGLRILAEIELFVVPGIGSLAEEVSVWGPKWCMSVFVGR